MNICSLPSVYNEPPNIMHAPSNDHEGQQFFLFTNMIADRISTGNNNSNNKQSPVAAMDISNEIETDVSDNKHENEASGKEWLNSIRMESTEVMDMAKESSHNSHSNSSFLPFMSSSPPNSTTSLTVNALAQQSISVPNVSRTHNPQFVHNNNNNNNRSPSLSRIHYNAGNNVNIPNCKLISPSAISESEHSRSSLLQYSSSSFVSNPNTSYERVPTPNLLFSQSVEAPINHNVAQKPILRYPLVGKAFYLDIPFQLKPKITQQILLLGGKVEELFDATTVTHLLTSKNSCSTTTKNRNFLSKSSEFVPKQQKQRNRRSFHMQINNHNIPQYLKREEMKSQINNRQLRTKPQVGEDLLAFAKQFGKKIYQLNKLAPYLDKKCHELSIANLYHQNYFSMDNQFKKQSNGNGSVESSSTSSLFVQGQQVPVCSSANSVQVHLNITDITQDEEQVIRKELQKNSFSPDDDYLILSDNKHNFTPQVKVFKVKHAEARTFPSANNDSPVPYSIFLSCREAEKAKKVLAKKRASANLSNGKASFDLVSKHARKLQSTFIPSFQTSSISSCSSTKIQAVPTISSSLISSPNHHASMESEQLTVPIFVDVSKFKNTKAGWCEVCRVRYNNYSTHVQTNEHRGYISNDDNYVNVDNFCALNSIPMYRS